MRERFLDSIGRALAECTGADSYSFEDFVHRAAWELQRECIPDFASLALIIRQYNGRSFVGASPEQPVLPLETLLGLLVEDNGTRVSCRVRDHALDAVRFIDMRFRTSIVVRLAFPKEILPGSEAALWVGLQGVASPGQVELAKTVGDSISHWLVVYQKVLLSLTRHSQNFARLQQQMVEMISAAHDARAPLGALRYYMVELEASYSEIAPDTGHIREELQYVETLLGKLSPQRRDGANSSHRRADVAAIVRRVCSRFAPEMSQGTGELQMELPAEELSTEVILEHDLERVLSNVVGNAVRYAGSERISITAVREGSGWVSVSVSDRGPGIPPSVVQAFSQGGGGINLARPLVAANGWGVGLLSCRDRVKAVGGAMTLETDTSGSTVTIKLPRVPDSNRYTINSGAPQVVAEEQFRYGGEEPNDDHLNGVSEPQAVHLLVIDDDSDHIQSLARALERVGVLTLVFNDVVAAVAHIRKFPSCTVVCDAHMPDGGAERLLRIVSREGLLARCAVMSGRVDDETQYRFAALGAREFFAKPIAIEGLVAWAGYGYLSGNCNSSTFSIPA